MLYGDVFDLYEQRLKRLQKVLPEGKSGQQMGYRTSESSYKYNPVNHKVDMQISSKDRLVRGNGTPISVTYRKSGNEEISMHMQRDHHRRERLQQTYREAPSIEIGPKRLKVRGPSYLGIESRLN